MLQQHCLNQKELARRWGISHRTLERWRYCGQGPAFLKLGGRVLYRRSEIDAFEQSQLSRALAVSNAIDKHSGAQGRRLTAIPQGQPNRTLPARIGAFGTISQLPQ